MPKPRETSFFDEKRSRHDKKGTDTILYSSKHVIRVTVL